MGEPAELMDTVLLADEIEKTVAVAREHQLRDEQDPHPPTTTHT